MKSVSIIVIITALFSFALGGLAGQASEHWVIAHRSAPAASIDPRIGEDIAELGKRTLQLAENQKAMQQEILQLHEDDKTIVGFVEMAFQSFFGGGAQAVPNSVRAER